MNRKCQAKSKSIFYYFAFAPFVFTILLLYFMPDLVPMHTDFWGNVDRWWSKEYQLIIGLVHSLIILLFVLVIKKQPNIGKISYSICITIILVQYFKYLWELLGITYLSSETTNIYAFEWNLYRIFVGILILIYTLCGLFIHKTKANGLIGLRTRWTLESEDVWAYIHSSFRMLFLIISGVYFLILAIPVITDITKVILSCIITLLVTIYLIYKSYRKYRITAK